MTEIEILKEENAKLKKELEETKAVSNQYLQNVAHQMTAPLGAIKWSIEALKDERVPLPRKKTLLSSIYSQATILVHLIKNFALMSNLEADHELGQFREKPEPIDVKRLSINLANDFQPQARDIGIKIYVEDESYHKVFGVKKLKIEKNMVAQAISNIIENAVKYADSDTIILMVAFSNNEYVGISVESTGLLIPDDARQKVFERGFRGPLAKQKVAAGTGFGLYLASRIMKFHGGKMEVKTQGAKSRFCLFFPKSLLTTET